MSGVQTPVVSRIRLPPETTVTCDLIIVLYLFKIIGINLKSEKRQLHMFEKNDTITAVKNTLKNRFEDNFF